MTKLLVINSSAAGDASVSSQLTQAFVAQLRAADPTVEATIRDVGSEPLPHLTPATLAGVRGDPVTLAEHGARVLSDDLVAELKAANIVVIAAPMYNFGITSTLKTWFDHVLRAGVTFRYSPEGPQGLLGDKRVVVIETRGGLYSDGPAAAMDAQEPHLRTMLGFVGIKDVTFVRAERLGTGAESRAAAIDDAVAELAALAKGAFAQAA